MTDRIFKRQKGVNETAAGGSTSGGSIAVVPSRMGGMQRRSLKDFMTDFYGRVANNTSRFHPIKMESSIKQITESSQPFILNDVVSRLKGVESQGTRPAVDTITFGVEDDSNNIMKVTIPKEQAESFELTVARALADVAEFKKTGVGENKTLAQLLYDLNSQFTIINAEFPKIPSEAVYNADEVSRMPEEDMGDQNAQQNNAMDDENPEMDSDEPEMGNNEPEMGNNEISDNTDDDSPDDDMDMEDDMEDDSVSSFDDEGEESLLRSVLSMLKQQSEKEIAQANAEAEKAKARQAELTYKASMKKLETEEEILQAEAEMEAEKEKEKEAKKLADLAKFKYTKQRTSEGFSKNFIKAIYEISDMDSIQSKRLQLRALRQKWKSEPDDTPEARRYKQQQLQNDIRMNRIEQQAIRDRDEYYKSQEDAEEQNNNQRQQQNQNQNRGQQDQTMAAPQPGTEQGRM